MERLKELLEKMKTGELTEDEQKEFDELMEKLEVKEEKKEDKSDDDLLAKIQSTVDEAVKKLTEPVKNKTVNFNTSGRDKEDYEKDYAPVKLTKINPYGSGKVVHDFKHKHGKFAGIKQSDVVFAKRAVEAFSRKGLTDIRVSDELEKAANMTSTGSGSGDEWVPSDLDSMLWEEWVKVSRVAQMFRIDEMPTQPYDLPIKTSDITFYKTSEDANITGSALGTGYGRLDACKMAGKMIFTYEIDEDSILSMAGEIRNSIGISAAAAIDDAILNGDTTTGTSNINLSGGTISTSDLVLCFNGLRHAALVDNTSMASDLGTLAVADFNTMLALMGKYNTMTSNLVAFFDPYVNAKMVGLTGLVSVSDYGAGATIHTGEVGSIFNIACIPTEELVKANSSGWVDNSSGSNTKGQIVLVHKPSWRGGYRRRLLIEADKDIETQELKLVASMRFAFVGYGDQGDLSAQTHTIVGYNVTV